MREAIFFFLGALTLGTIWNAKIRHKVFYAIAWLLKNSDKFFHRFENGKD